MDWREHRRLLIVKAAAFVAVLYAYFVSRVFMARRSRPRITYAPMSAMDVERQANLNLIFNCNDIECVSMLRMRRAPFFTLCNLLRDRNLLRDSVHCNVEEQVAMFLHVVGHNQRFRVVHQNFRRSIETVSRYFREVLYAIGELRGEMIRPPSNETSNKIRNSQRWYPYFKDCIGAIDGTHVRARVPAKNVAAFRGWGTTMAWYVVSHGRRNGVFSSWEACHEQVNGFSGALYKKYKTEEASAAFYSAAGRQELKMDGSSKNHLTSSAKSKDIIILVQSLVILLLVSVVVKMVWSVM